MRTIVITGASGDVAQALIALLPSDDVILALGRSQERLKTLYGDRANVHCYGLDVTDHQAVENFLVTATSQHGRIDILINNAGYGQFKEFDQFSDDQVRDMFEVNTLASIRLSRLLGRKMAEQGSGHIVTIASVAGLIATSKSSIYSATKFALIGFSNALRLELADKGVFVTTVNPGPISTKFFDQADPSGNYLQKVGSHVLTPEQVATKIVKNLGKNKRELTMPLIFVIAHKLYTLFPKLGDRLTSKQFNVK